MKSSDWLSALLLFASVATRDAEAKTSPQELSATEKWVTAKATTGDVADLDKQFVDKERRILSAHFVADLLTGALQGIKIHRNGVWIVGAIINEPVNLTNAQIPCEAHLEHCQFMGPVTFEQTNVTGNVSFDYSTFKASANFRGVKVAHTAKFERAVFEGPVDFNGADIAGDFAAGEAQFNFNELEQGANFYGIKIGHDATFYNAVFKGLVSFIFADIGRYFEAQSAHFKSNQAATFNSMKVGDIALFQNAVFDGPVDFRGADIAGNFQAVRAQFNNKEQGVSFNSIKIGHNAFLRSAVFDGPVDFVGADIAHNFEAQEAQFKNEKRSATFNAMKVGGGAFFGKAVFEGTADFLLADIAGNFEAPEAHFNNKDQGVYFYGMQVGKIARFGKAVFEGRVEFDAAEIAGNFEAGEAQFRNKTETVWLAMKCGRQGVFKDAVFAGPVSFRDSSFLDLVIGDMERGAAAVPRLDLSRSSIKRHLAIYKITIQDLVAPWLHVDGPADLTDITVEHSADLSYGDFSTLDLSRSLWPNGAGAFQLQEMSYKYIRAAAEEPESHKALLALANQSAYSADVYSRLEEVFLRQGNRADADKAFIAGKGREREEYVRSGQWFRWLRSWLLDWLVGYGRHPEQAGWFCLATIGLGCVLFPLKKMELQDPKDRMKPEEERPRYNRFWYSLGLFLPVVDLKTSEFWGPKKQYRFLRNYLRVHIILGWVLVPIFLAAITGLIK